MGLFDLGLAGGFKGLEGMFDNGQREAQAKNEQLLTLMKQMFGRPWQKPGGDTVFGQLFQNQLLGKQAMQGAVQATQTGTTNALSALGYQGQQAQQDITNQTQRGVAATQQGAASRGLFNSTSALQAGNQARYQGQQATGRLGEGLGRLFSATQLQGAGMQAGALQNLAQYYMQSGQQTLGATNAFSSVLSGFQYQPSKSPFEQLAPALGATLGAFL